MSGFTFSSGPGTPRTPPVQQQLGSTSIRTPDTASFTGHTPQGFAQHVDHHTAAPLSGGHHPASPSGGPHTALPPGGHHTMTAPGGHHTVTAPGGHHHSHQPFINLNDDLTGMRHASNFTLPAGTPSTQQPCVPHANTAYTAHGGQAGPFSNQPNGPPGSFSQLPHVPHTPPPQQRQSADPGAENSDGFPSRFVDALANEFLWGEAESDLRGNLHIFAQLGQGLAKPDLATRIWILGAIYELIKDRHIANDIQRSLRAMMSDITIRLDATFSVSKEQAVNVRLVAGELLYDPSRIDFMHLSHDVFQRLKSEASQLRFVNIFGNYARERQLMTAIKRACSSQRNALREMIRDSVTGNNVKSLEDFTYIVTQRFARVDFSTNVNLIIAARLAILRRFAYENLELLNCGEAEDHSEDNGAENAEGAATQSPNQSPRSSAAPELGSTGETSVNGKKRKLGPVLKPKKGKDFWSEVDKWFIAQRQQRGADWSDRRWKQYIQETVAKDHETFAVQEIVNPYMTGIELEDEQRASAMHGGAPSIPVRSGGIVSINIMNAL